MVAEGEDSNPHDFIVRFPEKMQEHLGKSEHNFRSFNSGLPISMEEIKRGWEQTGEHFG